MSCGQPNPGELWLHFQYVKPCGRVIQLCLPNIGMDARILGICFKCFLGIYIYILLVYSKFALSLHPKTSWLSVTISGKPLVQHHVYPLNGTRHFFVVKSLGGSCMSVAICLEKKIPIYQPGLVLILLLSP